MIKADHLEQSSLNSESTSTQPLISRILFDDIDDGEFISIFNPTTEELEISNWTLTDLEGEISFPDKCVIPASREITVARDASSFRNQHGIIPTFSVLANDIGVQVLQRSGSFRLSNAGDEIILINSNGEIVDIVIFCRAPEIDLSQHWTGPPVPHPGKGRFLKRQMTGDRFIDSNSMHDWLTLREYRPGQSNLYPIKTDALVTPLLLPEHSDIIIDYLAATSDTVLICTYEFDSPLFGAKICELAFKGKKVTILIEGKPVGGIEEESRRILSEMHRSGVEIRAMTSDDGSQNLRRYRFLHSKYIVIDDHISIIMSENIVDEVFDTELGEGNRGWGAIAESPLIAAALIDLFESDVNGEFNDVIELNINELPEQLNENSIKSPTRIRPGPPLPRMCNCELFLFPDCTKTESVITKTIAGSRKSICVQLFYGDLLWNTWAYGEILNPYLEAIDAVAESCEEITACLDNSWFSGNRDNADIIYFLERAALEVCENVVIDFPDARTPVDIIHNKGFVIDHRYSWISSANWNLAAISSNRELGLLIDNPVIARFFEECVVRDLKGDMDCPVIQLDIHLDADNDSWIIEISGDSDESGLRNGRIIADDGQSRNWDMTVDRNRKNMIIDVWATDLWDNGARTRFLLFPDGDSDTVKYSRSESSVGVGTFLSILSVAGASVANLPILLRLFFVKRIIP